jgi:signal transduction histidine kinase/predicted RNA-binding protein with RPS1 domain
MPEPPSTNHAGKPIHLVTVKMVKPGRVRVVNAEGNVGIIPEREWSLDRSIHRQTPSFVENSTIPAVFLADKSRPGLLQYSIAQLENPWKKIETRYKKGQIVTGEVVNLRNFAAFIQLEPGITAVAWDRNLPLLVDQIPSDELVIGDKVRGVISLLNVKEEKIELDVNRYLETRAELELIDQAALNAGLFESSIAALMQEGEKMNRVETQYVDIPALDKLQSVLVVDDKENQRDITKADLEKNYGAEVQTAANEKEALQLFDASPHFDLIVIDVNLGMGESGISLASKILTRDAQQNIIFFSSNLDVDKDIIELEMNYARTFHKAHKIGTETEDLLLNIDDFLRGRKRKRLQLIKHLPYAKGLSPAQPLEQSLSKLIEHLVEQEKLSHVFVLEINTRTRKTSVLVQYPPAASHTTVDTDALYYSPVRQVIEEGEDFHAWEVSPLTVKSDRRFKNLFTNFSFQACFGTPVPLSDQGLRHALFVLDKERSFLKQEIREKISKSATEVGTALERQRIFDLLLHTQDTYYKGQLLGAMIHELSNKLDPIQHGLEKNIKNLYDNISFENLKKLEKIQRDFRQLNELFVAYTKLANDNTEGVHLNQSIEKVMLQQRVYAKDRSVELFQTLDRTMPNLHSNVLQTEQIIANVLLNAIQQIEEHLKRIQKISLVQRDKLANVFSGTVTIRTLFHTQEQLCQIAIIDSGPGVPFDQRENIFEWGVTTREKGQGMGLYISRSLAETMGGRLVLADTIRFVGSVFVIEFPTHN